MGQCRPRPNDTEAWEGGSFSYGRRLNPSSYETKVAATSAVAAWPNPAGSQRNSDPAGGKARALRPAEATISSASDFDRTARADRPRARLRDRKREPSTERQGVQHLLDVSRRRSGASVRIRPRGSAATSELEVSRIVSCRGIASDPRKSANPLVAQLLAEGYGRVDPLGIGLDVDDDCALIDASGRASNRVFVAGPMSQAALWEVIAVPDIRLQAASLAGRLTTDALTRAARLIKTVSEAYRDPGAQASSITPRFALQNRLASLGKRNAERGNDAPAGAYEIGARAVCSDTAAAHARALDQEKERVGKEIRLRGAGGLTQIRQALALTHLEFLDHAKSGMALFGQFDGGVGEIAPALVLSDKSCGLVHETVKLTTRVPGFWASISAQISSDFRPL